MFSNERQVNLGGKKANSTKEEIVKQARLDREQRQQQKLLESQATIIQRVWRGHNTRKSLAQKATERLSALYETLHDKEKHQGRSLLDIYSDLVTELSRIYIADDEHGNLVSSACQSFLLASDSPGSDTNPFLNLSPIPAKQPLEGSEDAGSEETATAADHFESCKRFESQLKVLLDMCATALHHHIVTKRSNICTANSQLSPSCGYAARVLLLLTDYTGKGWPPSLAPRKDADQKKVSSNATAGQNANMESVKAMCRNIVSYLGRSPKFVQTMSQVLRVAAEAEASHSPVRTVGKLFLQSISKPLLRVFSEYARYSHACEAESEHEDDWSKPIDSILQSWISSVLTVPQLSTFGLLRTLDDLAFLSLFTQLNKMLAAGSSKHNDIREGSGALLANVVHVVESKMSSRSNIDSREYADILLRIISAGRDPMAKLFSSHPTLSQSLSAPWHVRFLLGQELLRDGRSTDGGVVKWNHSQVMSSCEVLSSLLDLLPPQTRIGLLSSLCFSINFLPNIWALLQESQDWDALYREVARMPSSTAHAITIFASAYQYMLVVVDVNELTSSGKPFSVSAMRDILHKTLKICYALLSTGLAGANLKMRDALSSLVSQLVQINERKQFVDPAEIDITVVDKANSYKITRGLKTGNSLSLTVLEILPFLFPFEHRAQAFMAMCEPHRNPGRSYKMNLRRGFIVEDAFHSLRSCPSEALHSTMHVAFQNEQGLEEAGIDQGGLWKEALTEIVITAFNPEYGLFKQTSERTLFPSSTAYVIPDYLEFFEFLGLILGKAIWDGVMVDVPFSTSFLCKLLDGYAFIEELPSLDPDFHKNLMFLKNYEGDVEDLALDFTVTEEVFGKVVEIDLLPGGKNIPVTKENMIRYIHLSADYRLNQQSRKSTQAFLSGFRRVIPLKFIQMFSPKELNLLISGVETDVDVDDWERNTKYSGGYSATDSTVVAFWKVVRGMTCEEKKALLRFTTSVAKAPLLGFSHLHPPFCIHRVRVGTSFFSFKDVDRLPSASTCFNLLKLPTYRWKSTLREKLLYAITSNAGFELS